MFCDDGTDWNIYSARLYEPFLLLSQCTRISMFGMVARQTSSPYTAYPHISDLCFGSAYNNSVTGAPVFLDNGRVSYMDFDSSSSQRLYSPGYVNGTFDEVTVMAWVMPSGGGSNMGIMEIDDTISLWRTSTNRYRFYVKDSGGVQRDGQSAVITPAAQWAFVAGTYSDEINVYVNGVSTSGESGSSGINTMSYEQLYYAFTDYPGGTSYYYDGYIAVIAIAWHDYNSSELLDYIFQSTRSLFGV